MNPLTIWKETVDIRFSKLISVNWLLTFAMEDIILSIGWDSVWTEPKSFSTLLQLLTDYLSHCGLLKLGMLPLQTITIRLLSTGWGQRSIQISSQVVIRRRLRMHLVIFMEVHTSQHQMELEPLPFPGQGTEFWSQKWIWIYANRWRTNGFSRWQVDTRCMLICWKIIARMISDPK